MSQKTILLLLELAQPRAQPFETLPEIAHVLRAIDLDRMSKVRASHLPDRLIELADRARNQYRKQDGERQRDQSRGERKVAPFLAPFGSCLLNVLDLTLGQARGRGQHRLRALGDVGISFGQGRGGIWWPMRSLQQCEKTAFASGESFELVQLRAVKRQQRELLRGLSKIEPQARIVVDQ